MELLLFKSAGTKVLGMMHNNLMFLVIGFLSG